MPTQISRLKKKQSPLARPTLNDLINATPSEMFDRARTQCRPLRAQYAIGSKNGWKRSYVKFPTYYNEQRVYTVCNKNKRYSYIRFFGPPQPATPVWIWCSCEYFKYYLEVALSHRSGSDIKTVGGPLGRKPVRNAPPVIRNPEQLLYLCKHLVVTAEIGLRQTQDMASIRYEKEYGENDAGKKKAAMFHQNANTRTVPVHAPLFEL